MARIALLICGAFTLGVLATIAWHHASENPDRRAAIVDRDLATVGTMPENAAAGHRAERYRNLNSIQQILELPTEFARAEAVHVLAGRSDSAAVQALVFEANRVIDDVERERMLITLFFRLAELDPRSALALARTHPFADARAAEQTVWHAWGRRDLDEALFAALTQPTRRQRNFAAQSLYAAFGYLGNATTDQIEAELGIRPDRSTRARYLYRLADRSPADAVEFINGLTEGSREYASWLGHYLAAQDAETAPGIVGLFDRDIDRQIYEHTIVRYAARENPQAVIERYLAGGGRVDSGELHSAISELARSDLDAAMQYFAQARSGEIRETMGALIAARLARQDPEAALAWARENDRAGPPSLLMAVIGKIAETEPQRALELSLGEQNPEWRRMLMTNVVYRLAAVNPSVAVAYVDQVPDERRRLEFSQQLAGVWLREDTSAALDWILGQDEAVAAEILKSAGYGLVHSDIDAAMRILPRLNEPDRVALRQRIAQQLAANGSPAEAQAFIRQFQGQPDFPQLQSAIIAGVAQNDPRAAISLADQLSDPGARDSAYASVIVHQVGHDPAEALRWLEYIRDDAVRGSAAGRIAATWHRYDPAAVMGWVKAMPAGPGRDDAIMQLAARWDATTAEQDELIASIGDRDKRGQAKVARIHKLIRTDPARARELLQDDDISDHQRRQLESMIQGIGYHF